MDDLLWGKYVASNLESMVTYGYALSIVCALLGLIKVYKQQEEFKHWLGLGFGLSLFVTFVPKERFLRTTIDTVACQVILKSEIAQVVQQLPATVEDTIKAETKKIPAIVDKALGKEFDKLGGRVDQEFTDLGDRVIEECKLF